MKAVLYPLAFALLGIVGDSGSGNVSASEAGGLDKNVLETPLEQMMLDYFVSLGKKMPSDQSLPQSKAEWLEKKKIIRESLIRSLGGFPTEKCPLNPTLLGKLEKDDYVIEKIIYQTRPNLYVTAHLYVPKGVDFPTPAVLSVHGHTAATKTAPTIQTRNIVLAKKGYVVLFVDAIGSGERAYQGITYHGRQLGAQAFLPGLSLQGLQVWDNIRAVDYLCMRPEVDKERIGVTGCSGGGNQTYYIAALEERIKAAVPVCGIGSYNGYLSGPSCVCEIIPSVKQYAQQADILALIAPRALLIVSGIHDSGTHFQITDVRERTYPRAKAIYELYGAAEKIALCAVDAGHGYNQEMREAMYAWFNKWLMGISEEVAAKEPEIILEEPESLLCLDKKGFPTPYETVPSLTYKAALELAKKRKLPENKTEWRKYASLTRGHIINEVFGGFPDKTDLKIKVVDTLNQAEYVIEKVSYTTEPGILVPALVCVPKSVQLPAKAVVYLHPQGKEAAFKSDLFFELIKSGYVVLALDYRGIGETLWQRANTVNVKDYQYFQSSTVLFQPYFGMCVWDILCSVDYLRTRKDVDPNSICCIGSGLAGLIALYASALDERIKATALINSLTSYAYPERFDDQHLMSTFLPQILKYADLAQIAALNTPKAVLIANGIDGGGKQLSIREMEKTYQWAKDAYQLLGANDGQFKLIVDSPQAVLAQTLAWLKQWF